METSSRDMTFFTTMLTMILIFTLKELEQTAKTLKMITFREIPTILAFYAEFKKRICEIKAAA